MISLNYNEFKKSIAVLKFILTQITSIPIL